MADFIGVNFLADLIEPETGGDTDQLLAWAEVIHRALLQRAADNTYQIELVTAAYREVVNYIKRGKSGAPKDKIRVYNAIVRLGNAGAFDSPKQKSKL